MRGSGYREPARARRVLLADVGLGLGERALFLFLPLVFLVPAAAVPVLFLRDVLQSGRVDPGELVAFVGGPLVVFAGLALLLAWIVRGLDLRQRVYEDGYERRYRGRTRLVSFGDIRGLRDDSGWVGSGVPRVLLPSFLLELDGESISLWRDGSFSRWNENAGRAASIYRAMDEAWAEHRGAKDLERIARGERCDYGLVSADRDGLVVRGEPLPWAEVARVFRERGTPEPWRIVCDAAGVRIELSASEVLDHPALLHVAARLTRG